MLRRTLIGAIVLVATLAAPSAAVADPHHEGGGDRGTGWYLALGDSLAAGFQPGQGDDKTGGYAGGVLAAVQADRPRTRLANLACSGETTTSMIQGGRCSYDKGSQLAQAVQFLRAHGDHTRLVTLDIGANDIAGCGFIGIPPSCTEPALATLRQTVPQIVSTLRRAAGHDVQIVVLNYYDPFLVYWLQGEAFHPLARQSVSVLAALNGIIEAAAVRSRAQTADVATAFSTTDFTTQVPLPVVGTVPLNVARICQWTTMCTLQDFHANDAGYAVLAAAVVARLERVRPGHHGHGG